MVLTKTQTAEIEELFQKVFEKEKEDMVNQIKDAFKSEINHIIQQHTQEINNLHKVIDERNKNISELEQKIKNLENKSEMAEMYSRKKNIMLFNIPEADGEVVLDVVVKNIKKYLAIDIDPSEIDNAHRVGNVNNGKTRAVIIKFVSYTKKMEILLKRRLFKGSKISAQEDLTKNKLEILKRAGEKFGQNNAWSLNGRIFVRTDVGKEEIKTIEDL